MAKKNKGSSKDLSFAVKIIVVSMFGFLFFRGMGTIPIESSTQLNEVKNQNNVFLIASALPQDSFSLSVSQGNTIRSSSILFHPKTQVLGVHSHKESRPEIISYIVQDGDTLSEISENFEISKDTIVWANNLKNNKINPKQELIILPTSGIFHIVEKGDTIKGISSRYGVDADIVIKYNNLKDIEISTGDILIVPGGKMPKSIITRDVKKRSSTFQPSSWLVPPTSGLITQVIHWESSIDIANNCGTPIYASASGVVQKVGYHYIGGNFVRILHPNGASTYYGHLSKISTSVEKSVVQGELIGLMGNTGFTIGPTGCHIHFQVINGSNPLLSYPRGHTF